MTFLRRLVVLPVMLAVYNADCIVWVITGDTSTIRWSEIEWLSRIADWAA